ncbi:phospholipid-transporting ATPase ID isoform X1 [Stomoxys calcitrans]|uniref:phospholipid-transporting ATPase ID isoform X1 n=1 Tax=Stomoxys calcitrans TaxID=35570 RepID=UPI0027E38861|nr:phospholipid-transporting ATPase ID isoform X1 [Stomoxys calcitrans]
MPNGNKRRPDTLELEVLRAPASEYPADTEQGRPPASNKPRRYAHVDNEPPPSTFPKSAPLTRPAQPPHPPAYRSAEGRPRRWYHFGGMFSRKASTTTTSTANVEAATATLAKPEPSTIDNSTATILTLSPHNVDNDNLPDVAAVLPRQHQDSFKRRSRKSRSESLYSLATLAQTGEIQLHSRSNSCIRFKDKEAEAEADTEAVAAAAALMYGENGPEMKDKTLLTSCRVVVPGDSVDEITDNPVPEAKSGLRASLMSFLGRFGIWKNSNCRPPRKRSSLQSKHTTPSGYSATEVGSSIKTRKSVNLSCDFEQFAADHSEEKSGRLANAKEIGKRRLSQIKRRRSSYYFSDNERRIRANDRDFNAQFKYADNYIKTSKYSMMTFLPFNLLEQFQRLANFYFLCLLVLQLIPAISSLTPVTTAIPLIGVLTLTAVKDAYDDIQRHVSDSQVNNRKSKALRNGKLVDEKWSGVQVGDVIRMENNQFVAADILLLSTSEPNGLCFIETAELDGETNLKCKQCLTETIELGSNHDQLWNFNAEIICEKPNNLLNKFEGTLMWRNQRYPLDNEKILLRGCVLRNTQWCYGVVVFAGKDTKLMQNSGKTQFKSTGVDRLLNFIIIGIVLFLLSICAFFTLACAIWEGVIGQHFQAYLPWENIIPKNIIQGSAVIGLLVFFSYAIVLNTVVPISLYVSVEVIRFVQSFLINWDEKMYYEPTKTHAKARTTTLNEELGQIQYIFSDKTGTLTQNIMTFNKCSINGRTYGDIIDLRTGEVIEITDSDIDTSQSSKKSTLKKDDSQMNGDGMSSSKRLHKVDVHFVSSPTTTNAAARTSLSSKMQEEHSTTSSSCGDKQVSIDSGTSISTSTGSTIRTAAIVQPSASLENLHFKAAALSTPSSPIAPEVGSDDEATAIDYRAQTNRMRTARVRIDCPLQRIGRQASTLSTYSEKDIAPVDFSANPEYEPEFRWYDRSLLDAVRSDEEHAHNFFRLLALCHTVMPEYVEGRLEYQAQSPDESALVSAARNFGFVFRSRTPTGITIEVMGRKEEYELLHILDFNNVRKRMSVILRQGDNIFLYCKGADSVIYDRLSSSQHEMKARTQDHLNKFAGEGLRTLVLAERQLSKDFYEDWSKRHMDASISLDNREDKLGVLYEEVESELVLVGVTAIEDKLQDGVPQTIANLQMAGIKIWVLTGDKQETAINIGYSCQLLTDDLADVFIVDGSTLEEVEKQLRQFKESIRIVNRFRPAPLNSSISLNLNGAHNQEANMTAVKMSQISPPPPPAISVVTFRWDDEDINKRNKGEPDSAETNELYDNLEKGGSAAKNALREDEIIEENTGFAIVINGHSLVHCLSPELEARFLDIASQCKAVICCRVTPLQKALVVELIKRAKNAVTLAIGDGANDVSMIKAAHIGVGISGQEGLQAVLASDYSIAQFRYLERLLLVHGRWSYYRMCKFLRYFFYKNFAFTLCHCWYSFFCGFSAQTVFDPMFISVYNLFYTSLPVLALGVFEQDVSDKHSLEYPKLYTPGLKSQLFNTKEFVYSVLHGAFSSLILFLIPYGTYHKGVSPNGYILSDHMTLGAVVATILIIDNTAQIALYTSYWTIANHITIWGSLIWYFVLDYFYNYVIGGPYVGSLTMAMKDLTFWTTMFITVVLIMIPVLAYKFYLIDVHPSLADMIRMRRRHASHKARHTSSVMRAPSSRRSRRSLRSGYAFAHQEGFGRLITSGKIMRKLPQEFAFPLGLGSKKVQSSGDANKTNNNNSVRDNKNAADMDETTTSALNDALTNQEHNSSDGISPRAPCQDLDTINL